MLPFEAPTIFEQLPRFFFKMPRVHMDQKEKFESDELFRRLSRESEIRYTGFRDRPLQERQIRFQNGCREGHCEIAFTATGTNLMLVFNPCSNGYLGSDGGIDFDKERGKVYPLDTVDNLSFSPQPVFVNSMEVYGDLNIVGKEVHLRSHMIMNGICIRFKGWVDIDRLDGVGCLEYDEVRGRIEEDLLRDQIELVKGFPKKFGELSK